MHIPTLAEDSIHTGYREWDTHTAQTITDINNDQIINDNQDIHTSKTQL